MDIYEKKKKGLKGIFDSHFASILQNIFDK